MSKGNNAVRAQALFALAWFHAVMQERRNFIPQVSAIELSLSIIFKTLSVAQKLF